MDLNEARKRADELGARAAGDPEFRERLANDPRGTLAAAGIPDELIDEIVDPDVAGHTMTIQLGCKLQPTTSNCGAPAPSPNTTQCAGHPTTGAPQPGQKIKSC
jgi:hypothetical protein